MVTSPYPPHIRASRNIKAQVPGAIPLGTALRYAATTAGVSCTAGLSARARPIPVDPQMATTATRTTPYPSAAPAQSRDKKTAAAQFQKGRALYAEGRWSEALEAFRAGHEAYPLPGFQVNGESPDDALADAEGRVDAYIQWLRDGELLPENVPIPEGITVTP